MKYPNLNFYIHKKINDTMLESEYKVRHAKTKDECEEALESASSVINTLWRIKEFTA